MDKWVNPFEKFLPSKAYAELVASNPIIPKGYIQIVEDIQDGKIGDGITPFNSLPFFRINLANGENPKKENTVPSSNKHTKK